SAAAGFSGGQGHGCGVGEAAELGVVGTAGLCEFVCAGVSVPRAAGYRKFENAVPPPRRRDSEEARRARKPNCVVGGFVALGGVRAPATGELRERRQWWGFAFR